MSDKTRAEYESIKSRWQTLGGTVEDRAYVEDATGKTYRYLTLHEDTSMDLDEVEEAVARLACLAVHDEAYLTMNVHTRLNQVTIKIGVATYDVPQHARTCERVTHPTSAHPCDCGLETLAPVPHAAVANVAREMLADAYVCNGCGQEIDPETCGCGAPRKGHGSPMDEGHEFVPLGCDCARVHGPERHGVTPVTHARPSESADPESESLGLGVEATASVARELLATPTDQPTQGTPVTGARE